MRLNGHGERRALSVGAHPGLPDWAFRAIVTLLLAWAPPSGASVGRAEPARPNVVFFLADDMGFSDAGCYGGEIRTPRLDQLAAEGLRFTQFYNAARCWPSRASLLSGYYPQQVNRESSQGSRPKWAALLPELLAPAGYRSYHSGKWHVDGKVLAAGFARSYHVTDHDRFFTPRHQELDDKRLPPVSANAGYYATTAIADHAIQWLWEHHERHAGEPFFLYVPFISPHFPLHALPQDIARYRDHYRDGWDAARRRRANRLDELGLLRAELPPLEPDTIPTWNLAEAELRQQVGPGEARQAVAWDSLSNQQREFQATKMAIHAAMVDRMDREIGNVLDQVDAIGARENTLVFFASDNGASAEQIIRGDGHDRSAPLGSAATFLGLGPGWSSAANSPFRKHKHWTHEGGIATPLIVRWPAGISARGEFRRSPAHLVDIVPTVLELAGVHAPSQWGGERRPELPGRSLRPDFTSDQEFPRDFLYFHHSGNRALRVGDWKIVSAGQAAPWELYDLRTDRTECHDLAASDPTRLTDLRERWERLDAEFTAQGRRDP